MTNYFVNGLQEETANNTNGRNMTGSDNLYVSNTGDIVALGAGGVSAIFLDANSTGNNVTINGQIYCANGDAVFSEGTNLNLRLERQRIRRRRRFNLQGSAIFSSGRKANCRSTEAASTSTRTPGAAPLRWTGRSFPPAVQASISMRKRISASTKAPSSPQNTTALFSTADRPAAPCIMAARSKAITAPTTISISPTPTSRSTMPD